jgi:hypothetical protein
MLLEYGDEAQRDAALKLRCPQSLLIIVVV